MNDTRKGKAPVADPIERPKPRNVAEAMASEPPSPRLDAYENRHGERVEIDRRRGVVTIVPSPQSAMPNDARKLQLTEEIDATLAFASAHRSETFLWPQSGERGMHASGDWYLGSLWGSAPLSRRLTRAQAAAEIFAAKKHYNDREPTGFMSSVYDGYSIRRDILAAALKGRTAVPACPGDEEAWCERIALDLAFEPYIRPGDRVEYETHGSREQEPRPEMMFLCATLPDDLDPKGARVEVLRVEEDLDDERSLQGIGFFDGRGRQVRDERLQIIGAAVAYTPKGGQKQAVERGMAFERFRAPEQRTVVAERLVWTRGAARERLWHRYEALDVDAQARLFKASIGGDIDWNGYPILEQGVVVEEQPAWMPPNDWMTVSIRRDDPKVGQPFYGVWDVPHETHPEHSCARVGLALMLTDRVALCNDGLSRSADAYKVIGHVTKIHFNPREEPMSTIDVEFLLAEKEAS